MLMKMPGKPLGGKTLLENPLSGKEVDRHFFGAMSELERSENLLDPTPDPVAKEGKSPAAGGKILPGNAGKEKRQEKDRQTEFRGERISLSGPGVDGLQGVEKKLFRNGIFRQMVERGKERGQHAGLEHQAERGFGRPFTEVPQKLIPDPGAGAKIQFGHMPEQGLIRFFFDAKTGAGRVTDHPDHPDRVLMEFFVRISDAADDAVLEIFQPSDVIDERKIPGVVKNPVDRNIPPQGVFRRGPEGVFPLRVRDFPPLPRTPICAGKWRPRCTFLPGKTHGRCGNGGR